jgi:hypothetical protein
MTALRHTVQQLQKDPNAGLSDLVAAFNAVEATYGHEMCKERCTFEEAVLPKAASASGGRVLLSGAATAPAPRDQRQPASGPGRGQRQHFVPQAKKADTASATVPL